MKAHVILLAALVAAALAAPTAAHPEDHAWEAQGVKGYAIGCGEYLEPRTGAVVRTCTGPLPPGADPAPPVATGGEMEDHAWLELLAGEACGGWGDFCLDAGARLVGGYCVVVEVTFQDDGWSHGVTDTLRACPGDAVSEVTLAFDYSTGPEGHGAAHAALYVEGYSESPVAEDAVAY